MAIAAAESPERKYRLEPGPQVRLRFQVTAVDLQMAMERVQRDGTALDRQIADQVMVAAVPFHQAVDRLFAAVDHGDRAMVLKIDSEEVDPRYDDIADPVTLTDLRCDIGQGYHLCRPAKADVLMQWLAQHVAVPQRTRSPARQSHPGSAQHSGFAALRTP